MMATLTITPATKRFLMPPNGTDRPRKPSSTSRTNRSIRHAAFLRTIIVPMIMIQMIIPPLHRPAPWPCRRTVADAPSRPRRSAPRAAPCPASPSRCRPAKSSRLASLQATHGPSSTRTAPPTARKSWWMPRPARSLTICRLLPLTGKRRMTFPRDRIICLTSTF